MKKTIFATLCAVLIALPAFASIFPNDTKSVYLDLPASGGTTCGTLLASSTHDRTALYATIRTPTGNLGTININGSTFLDNQTNQDIDTFAPTLIPAGESVTCTRANNKPFSFRLSYVDYDLTLVPNYQVSISSKSIGVLLASTSHDQILSQTASVSVYNTMTAGDIITFIMLFAVVMLLSLMLFFGKI